MLLDHGWWTAARRKLSLVLEIGQGESVVPSLHLSLIYMVAEHSQNAGESAPSPKQSHRRAEQT